MSGANVQSGRVTESDNVLFRMRAWITQFLGGEGEEFSDDVLEGGDGSAPAQAALQLQQKRLLEVQGALDQLREFLNKKSGAGAYCFSKNVQVFYQALQAHFLEFGCCEDMQRSQSSQRVAWRACTEKLAEKGSALAYPFHFLGEQVAGSANTLSEVLGLEYLCHVKTRNLPESHAWLIEEFVFPKQKSFESTPDWQTAVGNYLSASEKHALINAYYGVVTPSISPEMFPRSALQIVLAASEACCREIQAKLNTENFSIEDAQKQLWALYSHFSLSLGTSIPEVLVEFDRAFWAKLDAYFPEGHPIYIRKNDSKRDEYLKLLLLQQVMATKGLAYRDGVRLNLALEHLAEHRSWWGKLLHRLFGFQTKSIRLYRDYQRLQDRSFTDESDQTPYQQAQADICQELGREISKKCQDLREANYPVERVLEQELANGVTRRNSQRGGFGVLAKQGQGRALSFSELIGSVGGTTFVPRRSSSIACEAC